MNALLQDGDSLWRLAGWTMIHFLWIGTLVAIVGGSVRIACRRACPSVRYAVSLTTLTALALTPIGVAAWLSSQAETWGSFSETAKFESRRDLATWGRLSETARTPSDEEPTTQVVDLAKTPISDPPPRYSGEGLGEGSAPPATAPPPTAIASNSSSGPSPPRPLFDLRGRGIADAVAAHLPWVWLVGAPFTFVLLAAGLVGSERLRHVSQPLIAGPAFDACERLRAAMRVSRGVAIAACDGIAQPVLVGIVRPLILLPTAALAGWSPEELEMVLVHELAHVRRWDNLVNLVQRLIESLLFFHPAVWLVSRQVRRDREECCDAAVVAYTRRPEAYATLLVSIAASLRRRQAPPLALASAMAHHPLAGRIRRILKLEDEPMWISRKTLGLLMAACIAVVAGVMVLPSISGAADEETQPEKEKHSEPLPVTNGEADEPSELPTTRRYAASEVDRLLIRNWLDIVAKGEMFVQWNDDSRGIEVRAPKVIHVALSEFFTDKRSPAAQDAAVSALMPDGADADNASLQRLFSANDANPPQTVVYSTSKLPQKNLESYPELLPDMFEGLQKDPFGPQLQFQWKWIQKNKRMEITAPRAAHLWFRLLFSGKLLPNALGDSIDLFNLVVKPGGAPPNPQSTIPIADQPTIESAPTQFRVFKLKNARASLVTLNLEEYFANEAKDDQNAPKLRFIWDADTNTILVQGGNEAQLEVIRKLIEVYDVMTNKTDQKGEKKPEPISAGRPKTPTDPLLAPGDSVKIQVAGALSEYPIDDVYKIEPQGTLALGARYGRVNVAGKTVLDAEQAVQMHLAKTLKNPVVQITSATSAPTAAVAGGDAKYLYDGKTFEEWRDLWKNELKTEKRTEAIEALAVFGRAGLATEAAEAILDVAGEYDFSHIDDGRPDGKLKSAVVFAWTYGDRPAIGPEVWLPLLIARVRNSQDAEQDRWLSMLQSVLWRIENPNAAVRRLLLELAQEENLNLGNRPATVLFKSSEALTEPDVIAFARSSLSGETPNLGILDELDFRDLDKVPEQLTLLWHAEPEVQKQSRGILARVHSTPFPKVIDPLLALLDDPQAADRHVAAIRALSAYRWHLNVVNNDEQKSRVINRLEQVLREGRRETLAPAIAASLAIRHNVSFDEGVNINQSDVALLDGLITSLTAKYELSPERKEELHAAFGESQKEHRLILPVRPGHARGGF